jgi:thioredoxin 1
MPNVIDVTDATFANEVEQSEGVTIVDFWAPWCAPCRLLAPIVEQVASERGFKLVKVNTDENIATTVRFNVRANPTLLFFKDGTLVGNLVGAVPKSRLEDRLSQALATAVTHPSSKSPSTPQRLPA